jgi:hypothetical protein
MIPNNYTQLFTSEECDIIISYVENKNDWTRVDDGNRYNLICLELDWVYNRFIDYIKKVENINISDSKFVKCLKYNIGDFFKPHKDFNPTLDFYKTFMYNINILLNDDFEGGDFLVNNQVYPKQRGWAYYYSSNEIHEVREVTNGVRYSILYGVFSDTIVRNKLI